MRPKRRYIIKKEENENEKEKEKKLLPPTVIYPLPGRGPLIGQEVMVVATPYTHSHARTTAIFFFRHTWSCCLFSVCNEKTRPS
ncbi:hypothetical protein IF2G_03587 [Cordyceps javanica]|nr:hypothetical protein IF2G_03587 [Cordyceps javanica]